MVAKERKLLCMQHCLSQNLFLSQKNNSDKISDGKGVKLLHIFFLKNHFFFLFASKNNEAIEKKKKKK